MSDDDTFESVDAGSSYTFPLCAGDMKKGDHLCIKGFPCRIVDISTSKTGKHGHAKANITAIDIFTGKKYEEVSPTSHALPSPNVSKLEYLLVDITSDRLSVLSDDNEESVFPFPPDEELMKRIREAFDDEGKEVSITVTSAMGHEQVMDCKIKQA